MNGLLGATAAKEAEWRTRLSAARQATDAAFLRLATLLDETSASGSHELSARVRRIQADLAAQRARIGSIVALPLDQRAPAAMEEAVDGMMRLVPPLMGVNQQIGFALSRQNPQWTDEVLVAQSSATLREYAGQLGSRLVIALFRNQGLTPGNLRVIDQLEGRITQLRVQINARLAGHSDDPAILSAQTALEDGYFQNGLAVIEQVRTQEAGRPGGSGMSPGDLTDRYVPHMQPIEAIRDLMLTRAERLAKAERTKAVIELTVGASTVAMIFALLGTTGVLVHRHVIRPLIAMTREIKNLAAEDFASSIPSRHYFGELRDMIDAISILRGVSLHRLRLQREREVLLSQVKRLAETDHLTGLCNRRAFEAAGTDALARGDSLAVIVCDIDHFKQVNDEYGHHVGDEVLKAIAARLASALDPMEIVYRYGGEEFAVLVVGDDDQRPLRVAERLRLSVGGTPIALGDRILTATISLGTAWRAAGPDTRLGAIVARADEALYRAKRDGRNRVMTDLGTNALPVPLFALERRPARLAGAA